MQKVIGVKKDFDKEIYYFYADENIKVGDRVVISSDDFQTLATVRHEFQKSDRFDGLLNVKRKANDQDIKKYEELKAKAKKQLPEIKTKSLKLGLMMKFIGAQYSLDGSKIVIIFSSEDRVDFRQFLKDLASMLKTRIELRQIGQRDEVKACGGVGPCGEECCCARFLKDFEHVSVKMAKTQGLSLSPTKINGICGRLMCCLAYEASTYDEILEKMPKINSEITTPNGKGIVVYNDILRERVSVKRQAEGDSFIVEEFDLEELNGNKPDKKEPDKTVTKTISENPVKNANISSDVQSNEKREDNHKKFKKDKFKKFKNGKKQ